MKRRGGPAFIVREGSASVLAYKFRDGRFCLYYRKHAGVKPTRETKTGERAARDRAREIAIALANGRVETLELTNADRDSYLHAKSLLPAGVPLHSAIEEWASARKILDGSSMIEAAHIALRQVRTRLTVPSSREILGEMISELTERQRSDRHLRALRSDLRAYVVRFPRLEDPRASDIITYLREASERVGPRRRDNIRDAIVQLYRFARRHSYLPEDRVSEAEKIGRIKPSHDIRTWTPREAGLILEHVSSAWLPWMTLGMFAGLRSSEILRLDWAAVKFDQHVIAVSGRVARKVRTSRIVPIHDNLAAWLHSYRDQFGTLYPGNFKTTEDAKSREINRLEKTTGIKWRNNANRHSYGSYRLSIVKNFEQVAAEMGNSVAKVRENYNDPKPEDEGKAWFSLMPPKETSNVLALEFRC